MDLGLKGSRAFVAASSQGLGFASAQVLAEEGAKVAINGRDEGRLQVAAEEIERATGNKVVQLLGDISQSDVPAKVIEQAVDMLGGLDILITNSGGPPSGRFEDLSEEQWMQALELTFHSHRRLIRAALPHLRQSTQASVLTITSISAKQPIALLAPSNSGRPATIGLTKTLALELGDQGIRFNSILPSWTETQRVHELIEKRAASKGTSVKDELAAQTKESPLGRMGQPEEFGRAAAFLVSPAASYITGVMLSVDGGIYKGTV